MITTCDRSANIHVACSTFFSDSRILFCCFKGSRAFLSSLFFSACIFSFVPCRANYESGSVPEGVHRSIISGEMKGNILHITLYTLIFTD